MSLCWCAQFTLTQGCIHMSADKLIDLDFTFHYCVWPVFLFFTEGLPGYHRHYIIICNHSMKPRLIPSSFPVHTPALCLILLPPSIRPTGDGAVPLSLNSFTVKVVASACTLWPCVSVSWLCTLLRGTQAIHHLSRLDCTRRTRCKHTHIWISVFMRSFHWLSSATFTSRRTIKIYEAVVDASVSKWFTVWCEYSLSSLQDPQWSPLSVKHTCTTIPNPPFSSITFHVQ